MKRLLSAIIFVLSLLNAHDSLAAPRHGQNWWLSSGTVPVSYFGLTVQSYNYNFPPTEAWPTTKSVPLTIVRNMGVWWPGDGKVDYPVWSVINTSNGVYDWTGTDAWVAIGQANNVDMIFCLEMGPSWTGSSGHNPTTTQVTNFYSALATRYAGKIKYYEGFNEFVDGFSGTTAQLVAIQQAMYQAVKAADPNAIILSPTVSGIAYGGAVFYNSFLAAGGGQWFDIAAMHGYVDHHGETLVTAVSQLRTVLNANGLSNVTIIDTEGAWQDNTSEVISDTLQIAFTIKAFVLEYWLGVSRKVWYAYDNNQNVGTFYTQATGNLTDAGTAYI